MERFVDEETLMQVRESVLRGNEVPIPQSLREPKLELAKGKMQSYDPCFDLEKSRETKKVVGVVQSSNAFQAGLRNDQQLRRFSVDSAANPPIAELTVIDNGMEKQIRYEALGAPRDVRAFRQPRKELGK
jgi:hypothetical protein